MWLQVTARLGDTLIDVRTISPGGSYRIGRAAGVDLPWAGASDFPLVAPGGVVNRLPGMPATGDIVLGLVRVTIEQVAPPSSNLGRPGYGDARARGYLGASALLQIGATLAILAGVAPAATPVPLPPRVSLHAVTYKTHVVAPGVIEPAQPPEQRRTAARTHAGNPLATAFAAALAGGGATKLTGAARRAYEKSSGAEVAQGFAGLVAGVMGTADLKQLVEDSVYWNPDEGSEAQTGFGGIQRKFDPKLSVAKTGRYATVGHGHAAGDDYDLRTDTPAPKLEMCGGRGCVATGPTATTVIASVLGERAASIGACGKALRAPTTIYVSFEIAADGTVAHAHGTSALGNCVADVVASTTFPVADDATHVRYPVTFRPTAG